MNSRADSDTFMTPASTPTSVLLEMDGYRPRKKVREMLRRVSLCRYVDWLADHWVISRPPSIFYQPVRSASLVLVTTT